jgi:hypothetical protein
VPIPDYETIMLPLLKFASDANEHSAKGAIESWKQITNPILAIYYFKAVIIFVGILALAVLATYLFMCYYGFLRAQKETSVNVYSQNNLRPLQDIFSEAKKSVYPLWQ